jgi:oligopeptide/dipeptide ABC transporter ATP-binding protein
VTEADADIQDAITADEVQRAPDEEGVVLAVENLSVDFPTEDGVVHAVRGVSYALRSGEVLGIVGESGSGKSVSCMAIMGLLPKSADIKGSVRYRGEELLGLPEKSFNRIRGAKIAMIFQDPMTSLNPVHRVGHQIAEGVRVHEDIGEEAAIKRAVEMLDLVGIPNAKERVKNYPHEFSGGMRQRAMIAIAVANDPDIVIADEPTTALDVTVQAQVLEVLKAVKDEFNSAIILITHDLGVVAGMADRLMVMYAGRQVEFGGVDEIYEHPRMPYTLGLIGALPRLDSDGSERLVPIKGAPPSLVNLPPGCPFQPRCPLARPLCNEIEPDLVATHTPDHLAACHFWKELSGDVAAEDVFEVTAVDADLVAEVEATVEAAKETVQHAAAEPSTREEPT